MPGSVATHFSGNAPGPDEAWKIQPEDLAEMVLYLLRTPQRTLPSKIEVRPSRPPGS
jgi:NADP-dependent 3-hydroxy acid dehydrogenase YdfG